MAFLKKKDVTLNDLVFEKDNQNVDVLDVDLGRLVGLFTTRYKEFNKDNSAALKKDYAYLSKDDVMKLMLMTLSDILSMMILMKKNNNKENNC